MARVKNTHTGPFWRLGSGEVGNVPDWMADAYSHILQRVEDESKPEPEPAPAPKAEEPVKVDLAPEPAPELEPEKTQKQKRRERTTKLKAEMRKVEDPELLKKYLNDDRPSIRKEAVRLIEKLESK